MEEAEQRLNDALIRAVRAGDQSAVEQALRDGASPNASWQSCSALWSAAYRGYAAVVRRLAELGASTETPRKDGTTPVSIAAQKGHEEVARLLTHQGAIETEEEAAVREEQLLKAFDDLEVNTRQTLHTRAEFKSAC